MTVTPPIKQTSAVKRKSGTQARTTTLQGTADRDKEPPLYQQVVHALRQDIVQGVYAVGQNLPAEHELCERFGLSRHTVREALRELRASGLVVSRQGSGTTVARQDSGAQYYLHQSGSLSDLLQYTNSARWDFELTEETVGKSMAARLESRPGERWLRLEGARYSPSSPTPIYWTQAYLHGDYAGVARLLERRTVPIFELIEDMYGVRVGEVKQVMRGRTAPAGVAALLGLGKAAACLLYTSPSPRD